MVYGVLSPFRLKTTIDWVNEATNIDFAQFWIWRWARSVSWLLNSCLLTVFLHGKERDREMDHLSCVSSSKAQLSSVAQSCPTLRDRMNCSTPGLPVHHHLPEFTQTHVHRVSDAIQPSHPLSSPSPPAPNPYQHQSLFQ